MAETNLPLRVWNLGNGYEIRQMTNEALAPYLKEWHPKVFGENGTIFPSFSEEEKAATKALRQHMGTPLQLAFGVFRDDAFAGWHEGFQKSAFEYYMRNSAILPEHRGKGLYSALLKIVKEHILEMGFQEITSRHNATNNAVIVPKLKQGFVITALEANDVFGVLIHLVYHANAKRRSVLDFRVGMSRPTEEMLQDMARGHP